MKYPFILKGFFVLYSLGATASIFMLTFALVINATFFITKFSKSFVSFNYYVFGPGMVIPGILALCNFDRFIYTCEIKTGINMVFNISNAFSIIICSLIGLVIWIAKGLFDTFDLFSNSMTRNTEGSSIIRNAFWWSVMKIGRSDNINQNNNNDQVNLVNENDNSNRVNDNDNYNNLQNESEIRFDYNNRSGMVRMPITNVNDDLENNIRAVNSNNLLNRQENSTNNLLNEGERQSYNREFIMERNLDYLNSLRNKNRSLDEEDIKFKNQENHIKDSLDPNITQIHNINNSRTLDNTSYRIENESETRHFN